MTEFTMQDYNKREIIGLLNEHWTHYCNLVTLQGSYHETTRRQYAYYSGMIDILHAAGIHPSRDCRGNHTIEIITPGGGVEKFPPEM